MTVLFEPGRELPLVRFGVSFRVGRVDEPAGRDGLARLTARMLRRGSRTRDAEAVENTLDRLGAELSARVGIGATTIRCETLSRSLDEAVALVAELLAEPRHAVDELGRLQRQTVAEIVRDRDDDAGLASRALRRHLFADHPHGQRVAGTRAGVGAIERDEVAAFHRAGYVRADAIVAIAGDLSDEAAAQVAERLIAGLPEGAPHPYAIGEPTAPTGRRLVVVDKADRAQTQLAVGTLGTHPKDADHVALTVANCAFGGTFSSTLMQAIRVDRGWSYGASSSLTTARIRELFAMWTAPAAEDAAACLALELELLARLAEDLDDRAVSFAKNHIRAAWPFEIDTPEKRLAQRLDRVLLDLPDDYHANYLDRVAAVTLADARAAVRARIDPARLWIAAVGDESLRASLEVAVPDLVETIVLPYDAD